MATSQVMTGLQTDRRGLSGAESEARLKSSGPNIVSSLKPPSWWLLLLMVISNLFNVLLGFLAIISVASPDRSWVRCTALHTHRDGLNANPSYGKPSAF